MVTKTIPSKPKASKMEAELAAEEDSLTPEQEAEAREKAKIDNIIFIRIEQLYPFPKEEIDEILRNYSCADEVYWCQEEHKNMGAWHFIRAHFEQSFARLNLKKNIEYVGRSKSASPAAGYSKLHLQEQEEFISKAIKI